MADQILVVPAANDAGSGGALRTAMRIFEQWHVRPNEAITLLAVPRATFYHWRNNPPRAQDLPRDTKERLSYVLGIYKALHILLPQEDLADGWLSRPNSAAPFNGERPLHRMLGGNVADLYEVRRYLDGMRG